MKLPKWNRCPNFANIGREHVKIMSKLFKFKPLFWVHFNQFENNSLHVAYLAYLLEFVIIVNYWVTSPHSPGHHAPGLNLITNQCCVERANDASGNDGSHKRYTSN